MVALLDRLITYFSLFELEKCRHGQVIITLCFRSSTEYKTACSNPVQPSHCEQQSQVYKSDKLKLKRRLAHFGLLDFFMRFGFTQMTHI